MWSAVNPECAGFNKIQILSHVIDTKMVLKLHAVTHVLFLFTNEMLA